MTDRWQLSQIFNIFSPKIYFIWPQSISLSDIALLQQVLILSYQIILKYFLQMVVTCNILPSGNNIFYDIQYIFGYFPQISLNLVSEY